MRGTAEAGAGVPTGIEVMRSGLIAVVAVSMMTGTEIENIIVTVIAGGAGPQVLDGGGEGVPVAAEVLLEGGIAVQSGMVVRRDVRELSNGTERGKRKNLQVRLIQRKPIMAITEGTHKMLAHFMRISSNINLLRRDIDLSMLLVCIHSLLFVYSIDIGKQF
jgi:hypothetical protein